MKVELLFLQKPLMLGRSQARIDATFAYRGFRGRIALRVRLFSAHGHQGGVAPPRGLVPNPQRVVPTRFLKRYRRS